MKKSLMFVAVAAAGMLASCSSDSLTAGSDPEIKTPVQDELVPIEIGVATNQIKASTRGTGTAGGTDVDGDENIWRGERINVMMYQITDELPTFNPTLGGANGTTELYNNISMVTPLKDENKSSGIAKEPKNPAQIGGHDPQYQYTVKYYPPTGRSDFWGYYLGGYGYTAPPAAPAAGDAAGNGDLKMYTDAATLTAETDDPASATCVATAFEITGTHDLLVGQAPTNDPTAYSAKAARAGVQPNIAFKHLLSRLKFKVKPGLSNGDGIKVTAIKVRSLTTGKMIVAYKYKDGEGDVAEPTRIVWDPAQTDLNYKALPQLELKQRNAGTGAMEDLDEVELEWADATLDVYTPVAAGETLNAGTTYYTFDGVDTYTPYEATGEEGPVAADTYFELTPASPAHGELKSVGEALIVAPQAKYEIEVDYEMDVKTAREWYNVIPAVYTQVPAGTALTEGNTYYTSNTGAGEFVAGAAAIADASTYELTTPAVLGNDEGELVGDDTTYYGKLITDLVRTATTGDPATPKDFAAGDSYLITITLYGPEEIKITTTLDAWDTSDQDIEIGQDE